MSTFSYIDTQGNTQAVEADTWQQAIQTAPQRDPNSGVQLVKPPTVVNSDIANQKVDQVNKTITDYSAQNTPAQNTPAQKIEALDSGMDTEYDAFKTKMVGINRRDLSPEEQSELDNIQSTFDRTRALQEKANKEYEMGTRILGIRQGRNRYAAEIEMGNIKAAIDQGITKLADIDSKAKSKIFEVKQAMLDKKFDMALKEYNVYADLIKEKKKTIFDLSEMARQDQRLALDQYNATRTAEIKEYEYAVNNGYTGTLMDYKKAASDAGRVGITGGNTLTENEAKQYGLPLSLVGMNEKQLVSSFNQASPPEWFKSIFKGSNIEIPELLQREWTNLINDPNIKVYKDLLINKTTTTKTTNSDNPFS